MRHHSVCIGLLCALSVLWSCTSTASLPKQADKHVQTLYQQVVENPNTLSVRLELLDALFQEYREHKDVDYLEAATKLIEDGQTLEPNNALLTLSQVRLQLIKHQFAKAHTLLQGIPAEHHNEQYDALLADTLIELGKYAEATTVLQRMADRTLSFNALVRIAYIREIYGDIAGAHSMMQNALALSSDVPEHVAWTLSERGRLELYSNVDQAEASFTKALEAVPTYAPALYGKARTAIARNNLAAAETLLQEALSIVPSPEYSLLLADTYSAQGQDNLAEEYYSKTREEIEKSIEHGTEEPLELHHFYIHIGNVSADLIAELEELEKQRPTIFIAGTLASAYDATKQYDQARQAIDRALRTNTKDAEILYHAGIIAMNQKNSQDARAFLQGALDGRAILAPQDSMDAEELLASLTLQ